jgi:hypothetical protein
MSHVLGSARESEGIDPHIPKGTPTLGSWSLGGLSNLQNAIVRFKTHHLEDVFISLKRY